MSHSDAHLKPVPAEAAFTPGPVLLLGAPGVGKGTQAQLLMAEFGIPQISTGDLLRDHRARRTKLGELAESLMSKGQLVPDDLVNEMVADRLTQPDTSRGYILDGFPRTLPQAIWLDKHLAERSHSPESRLPVVAISIQVGYDELLRRIVGRRTCPVCRSIYNIYSNLPLVPGMCDVEGATLVQRSDDTEEVFAERMKAFSTQTAPVIEHYRSMGRFEEIEGNLPVEQVTAAIRMALRRFREAQS